MVKAVIFDLGSVLAVDEWPLVYKKIARKTKIPEEEIKKIVCPLFSKWCAGQINEEGFWNEFERRATIKLPKVFIKGFLSRSYKRWSKNIKGTWEIAKVLKDRGIRLALLSNTVDLHVSINEETGRLQKLRDIGFEVFVYSYEVGCEKPCYQMYETVLKRLHLLAKDCVLVDDKIKNIEGAEKLGIGAILFQGPELLRESLINFGLLPNRF